MYGILLGFGSAGTRHARLLGTMVDRLAIVDPSPVAEKAARSEMPQALFAKSLQELRDDWPWADSLAIIATWGPSHSEIFFRLAELGVQRIVCEKPLAHSVELGDSMIRHAHARGITLGVNHIHRYMRRSAGVEALAERFELGEPVLFALHSGAACIVTSGVHLIDMAIQLFHEPPSRVVSTVKEQRINPRSQDLGFYGGTAVWSFSNGREAAFSMSNSSSVAPSMHVIYRNAVIDLVDNVNMRVRVREPEAVAKYSAITRLSPASRIVFEGTAPEVVPVDQAFHALYREVSTNSLVACQPEDGLRAVEASIAAIAAGESSGAMQLPIPPGTDVWKRTWPIS